MPRPYNGKHRESGRHRADLPCPHPTPFLLVDNRLICPWRRRPGGELAPWQAEQLQAALARLAQAGWAGELPRLAWVTPEAITALPRAPEPAWVARKLHDGQQVALARAA